MWPIPLLKNEFVTISFSDNNLILTWLHKTTDQKIQVQAHQHIVYDNFELENLVPFNPTEIKKDINAFFSRYSLHNSFTSLILESSSISEPYVSFPTSAPKKEDFGIPPSRSILWNYHYLYQNDEGQFVFYVYKIPRSLILQYSLLAIATKSNVIMMTTQTIALLEYYKHSVGQAFRHSKLAVDMMNQNNNIHKLVSTDTLHKLLTIPPYIDSEKELPYLAASYGLYKNQGLQ